MKYLIYLLLAVSAFGQTTPNLHLNIPPQGTANYDALMNANWGILDGRATTIAVPSPVTAAGITSAASQASATGGLVQIPPTKGCIDMGATSISLYSNVHIVGAGEGATCLQWSVATNAFGIGGLGVGLTNASLENLTINFAGGAASNNSSALRLAADDSHLVEFNRFRNLHVIYPSASSGSQSAAIFITGTGAATDVVLNSFENIWVEAANQIAQCNSCEGNFWHAMFCQNCGWNSGQVIFSFTGLNANELVDARIEHGSGNVANLVCFGVNTTASGFDNQVRLTCDTGLTGSTAILEAGTATNNIYDIDVVEDNTTTIGTITAGSQYRYVNGSLGTSTSQLGTSATVGGSSVVRAAATGTATVDLASVASGACTADSSDVTLTGASVGDPTRVTAATALPAGVWLIGRVTATNTGRFQLCNLSGGAVDRASDTYTISVVK